MLPGFLTHFRTNWLLSIDCLFVIYSIILFICRIVKLYLSYCVFSCFGIVNRVVAIKFLGARIYRKEFTQASQKNFLLFLQNVYDSNHKSYLDRPLNKIIVLGTFQFTFSGISMMEAFC